MGGKRVQLTTGLQTSLVVVLLLLVEDQQERLVESMLKGSICSNVALDMFKS